MNLRSLNNLVAGIATNAAAAVGFFRQIRPDGVLSSPRPMTPIASTRAKFTIASLGLACLPIFTAAVSAQTNYYNPNGTEYAIIGSLPGDQVYPDAAVSTNGGFVVWQDNITDGSGWGISARQVNSTLSGTLGTFRVNYTAAGDQEHPRVALFKSGGAVFVWQGGQLGYQHVFAGFLTSSNTFLNTSDIEVNTFSNNFQVNPAVAVLNNSNVVVVWGSYDEASSNSQQDVYGQILSPAGQKIGGEFLVNQQTAFNQRSPAVAALPGGGFIVTWISEQQRVQAQNLGQNTTYTSAAGTPAPSVDVYARTFNNSATPLTAESLVNSDSNPCAAPCVSVASDGSYLIAWTAHDQLIASNSFDIYGRTFNSAGVANAAVFRINSYTYGDQYIPRASAIGLDFLVTWTSLAEDGDREGVYGQFIHNNGSLTGSQLLVNTTTLGQQMQPVVTSDGAQQFLVVWTSFTGPTYGFDLYAQRYLNVAALLAAMPAPYVWAPFVVSNNVYQPELIVSWAPLLGITVSNYEVYLNGSNAPAALVTTNQWIMTAANGLTTNQTVSFQVDYVTAADQRSPRSPSASGTTWHGSNWGGIPYEWMIAYYGSNTNLWPAANSRLNGTPVTLLQIFLSGGSPLNPATWLKQQLIRTSQGLFLSWNPQPGATYQVQSTSNFTTWSNVGSPRFAAGTTDSIYVGGGSVGYYRVLLLR